MATQVGTAAAAPPHVCPQCAKSFSRLCDLNKHSKSHSRPYKCKDPGCKYSTRGWPTAKELERHYNDKHSATPRTFPCLFQPCTYWSKRQSNCKQHMEKAHDWKYVRSKSKGKRLAAEQNAGDSTYSPNVPGMAVDADHNTSAASSSPQSLLVQPQEMDFILYDDDQADALGDDDDPLYGYGDPSNAESYLPWTSPMTRLRKNELFIETFSQTYNGTQENTHARTMARPSEAELGPVLSNFSPLGIPHCPQAGRHAQFVGDAAIKVESPVLAVDEVSPMKRNYALVEYPTAGSKQATHSASGMGPPSSRKPGAGQGVPVPSKARAASKHWDNSGEDGCPPKKRSKLNPAEDFTDTSMPDIFRFAHPQIYDRDRTEKYSPCHTVHRDISTLVRHLSRPAHRLKVTERVISSFEIDDPDFRHPRVGVCRTCWHTFDQRSTFDAHVSRPCQKISKGKREKWRVLLESFTPLCDSADNAFPSTDPVQHTDEPWLSNQQSDSLLQHDNDTFNDARTPPTSVPSPAIVQSSELGPLNSTVGRFVSVGEHDRLQREHEALLEKHQQLERMTSALIIHRMYHDNMKQVTEPQPNARPSALGSSRDSPSGASPAVSDRESLFQHMDSQSTDVDVHAFMAEMEDTRQTLSRMNSGLSTASRSTIHHVPPSPPSRPAELPDSKSSGDPSHQQQAKHALAHRQLLPSIPDSGYGTEQRRGSLGDLPTAGAAGPQEGMTATTTTKLLTPPSTAEAASKTGHGDGLPSWGALGAPSPTGQRTPRQGNTSPPHSSSSQPGFLTEQEMAAYDDDSYNLFYQDHSNILTAGSSPFDFTFEYPSQVE